MPTDCNPAQFEFPRLDGRAAVVRFDGDLGAHHVGALGLAALAREQERRGGVSEYRAVAVQVLGDQADALRGQQRIDLGGVLHLAGGDVQPHTAAAVHEQVAAQLDADEVGQSHRRHQQDLQGDGILGAQGVAARRGGRGRRHPHSRRRSPACGRAECPPRCASPGRDCAGRRSGPLGAPQSATAARPWPAASPAVRGQPTTIERRGDLLAPHRWKGQRQAGIIGHGGCGSA